MGIITEGKLFCRRLKELIRGEWGEAPFRIVRIPELHERKSLPNGKGIAVQVELNGRRFNVKINKQYVYYEDRKELENRLFCIYNRRNWKSWKFNRNWRYS